jgi:hypothetical protein
MALILPVTQLLDTGTNRLTTFGRGLMDVCVKVSAGAGQAGAAAEWPMWRLTAAGAALPVIRLHDLRRTHATLLLAKGVPVKVCQRATRPRQLSLGTAVARRADC